MAKLRLIRVVLGTGITSFVAAFFETLSVVLILPSLSTADIVVLPIFFVANVFLIIGIQRIIVRKAKRRLAAGLNKDSQSRRELEKEAKKGSGIFC